MFSIICGANCFTGGLRATWGMIVTLGWVQSLLSAGKGSGDVVSTVAAAIWPESRGSTR